MFSCMEKAMQQQPLFWPALTSPQRVFFGPCPQQQQRLARSLEGRQEPRKRKKKRSRKPSDDERTSTRTKTDWQMRNKRNRRKRGQNTLVSVLIIAVPPFSSFTGFVWSFIRTEGKGRNPDYKHTVYSLIIALSVPTCVFIFCRIRTVSRETFILRKTVVGHQHFCLLSVRQRWWHVYYIVLFSSLQPKQPWGENRYSPPRRRKMQSGQRSGEILLFFISDRPIWMPVSFFLPFLRTKEGNGPPFFPSRPHLWTPATHSSSQPLGEPPREKREEKLKKIEVETDRRNELLLLLQKIATAIGTRSVYG